MEKKTLGAFIAVLRKENGMTQKDLAERLHVSDKTVSRWERNDGTPDPTAILTLAEVFGVSCDELLRGERQPIAKPVAQTQNINPGQTEKTQTFLQYKNMTCIATGLSLFGLIVSFLCFFMYFNVVLVFLFGVLFFAASIVLQSVAVNKALAVAEKPCDDVTYLLSYQQKVICTKQKIIGLNAFFIFFTLSLIPLNAVFGLGDNILLFFFLDMALFLLPYVITIHFRNKSLYKKGILPFPAKKDKAKRILHIIAVLALFAGSFLFLGYEIIRCL